MSAYVVWIDGSQAKVFKMLPQKVESKVLRRKEIDHHTSNDPNKHKDHGKFFHELASLVTDASELLLVGPGKEKDHFKTHLDEHHHVQLAKKIVGVVPMDHPTDPQILAEARKFFKVYDTLAQR